MDDKGDQDRSRNGADELTDRYRAALLRRAQQSERRGLVHLEGGSFLAAIEALTDSVDLYQRLGATSRANSALQYVGLARYERGEIDAGVEIWEGLVASGWARPTSLNFLVRHYESTDDPDKVEELYEQLARSKAEAADTFFSDFEDDSTVGTLDPELARRGAARILIADNDPDVRKILERLMRFQGHAPILVEDGEAALATILRDKPDIIFLDVYMPKQSGLDVLYRIRAEGIDTPVVVISGRTDATMVSDAKELGARFFAKPLDFERLEVMVKEFLEGA